MHKMADQFDAVITGTIQSLVVASENLKDASVGMKSNAEQSQDASSTVTSAAQETSRNVSTVSSASEEMNASACEISRQVSDVVNKAKQASNDANDTSIALILKLIHPLTFNERIQASIIGNPVVPVAHFLKRFESKVVLISSYALTIFVNSKLGCISSF